MLQLSGPEDVTLDAVERAAWCGEAVTLTPAALERVERGRVMLLEIMAAGARIYAVNTGTGYLAGHDLSEAEQAVQQRNLPPGRAVGSGPYLETAEARAVLVVRLVNFLSGHAGVTPDLCRFVAERLNDGFTPAIPRHGHGAAGDLIALAHAGQTLLGVGCVLDERGAVVPAAEALAARGVAPYRPAAKEGIALLAGAPVTTALAVARLRSAKVVADHALLAAACAIDALRAPLDAYGPALARLSADPLLAAVVQRLQMSLRGTTYQPRPGQAPVSFRVVPQVHAHLERTLARFADDTERALRAVTDSPAVVDGEIVTSGEFHAVGVVAGMDGLAAALARTAELSAQRLHRLLDRRFSGLPDQLTPLPGPRYGLVPLHKRVVGSVHELRRLAAPASVGLIDTSLGQEDAMTFFGEAAENLRRVTALTREVLACELLAARQAWWLRDEPPADGLQPVAARLADLVPPVDEDRPLGADVERLVAAMADDDLERARQR